MHQNNTHTALIDGCSVDLTKKVMNSRRSLKQYEPEVSTDSKDDEFRLMYALTIRDTLKQPRKACGPKLSE